VAVRERAARVGFDQLASRSFSVVPTALITSDPVPAALLATIPAPRWVHRLAFPA
jgi:hypothetical protein